MSQPVESGRPPGWRIAPGDGSAILWAIACCWLAVGGNYLLLHFKLTAAWIVPVDLFAVPLLVTLAFHLLRRRRPKGGA